MLESLLIKNVNMVLPNGVFEGDLKVEKGIITEIGPSLSGSVEKTIDEKGLVLMPGCIDPHVHFRDPGVIEKEDLYTGSCAAAAGGITSFFEMPNTKPSTTSCALMAEKKKIAAEKSIVNYNFFIGATPDNLDELKVIENVPGIKIYVGSSTGSLLVNEQDALESIFKNTTHLIAVHAEDEATVLENKERYKNSTDVADFIKIRTVEAALKCTKRVVELAQRHKHRLHICHLTTAEEALFLKDKIGSLVTTEVCPQHLFLWAPDIYTQMGTLAQINPPIREKYHAEGLWTALKSGLISMVVTDHAPHLLEEKLQVFGKAPSGMPGIETSLALMLNQVNKGACTLENVAQWMSKAPADVFRIQNKGQLKVGFDADMVLVDMKKKARVEGKKFKSKAKWSAFEGMKLQGWPLMTLVNGQMVYREGDILDAIKGKEVQIQSYPR